MIQQTIAVHFLEARLVQIFLQSLTVFVQDVSHSNFQYNTKLIIKRLYIMPIIIGVDCMFTQSGLTEPSK